MSDNSKTTFVIFFFSLTLVFSFVWWFISQERKVGNVKQKEKKKVKKEEKALKGDLPDEEKIELSIDHLKGFYNSEVGRIPTWDCTHKRALLEFIFVKKEDNEYEPVKGIFAIDTKKASKKLSDKNLEKSDCPYRYGTGSGDRPFVHYMNVATHCKNCNESALIAGETYKLVRIGEHKELNYTFQVPPAEKLVFKHDFDHDELKGTKDDPVHRIPVIVEEAVETKKEPETSYDPTAPVPEKTLTVKGLPELAESERLLVHYMHEGGKQRDAKKVSDGTWEITLRQRGLESTTGGSLVLYRITPSERKRNGIAAKLIGYVPEVPDNPLNLADVEYRNYDQKTWHRERIKLSDHLSDKRLSQLKKQDPEKVEEQKGVFLDMKNTTTKEPVHVSLSQVEVEQGNFYVTLTAPPGTYKLSFEEQVIDSDFDWPRK